MALEYLRGGEEGRRERRRRREGREEGEKEEKEEEGDKEEGEEKFFDVGQWHPRWPWVPVRALKRKEQEGRRGEGKRRKGKTPTGETVQRIQWTVMSCLIWTGPLRHED